MYGNSLSNILYSLITLYVSFSFIEKHEKVLLARSQENLALSDNDQEVDEHEIRKNETDDNILSEEKNIIEGNNKGVTKFANDPLETDLEGNYLLKY